MQHFPLNNMLPNFILAVVLAFTAAALAADQGPDVSGPLTLQYRPHTKFETCRSSSSKTNCGFCYGTGGTFLGWNCACDTFVSIVLSVLLAGSATRLLTWLIVFWNHEFVLLHFGVGSEHLGAVNVCALISIGLLGPRLQHG